MQLSTRHRPLLLLVWASVPLGAAEVAGLGQDAGQHPLFERDILPIVNAYCVHCHGWVQRQGELDMRSLPLLLKGGQSGPAIKRGNAGESLLYQKIASKEMPPTGEVQQKLSRKNFIVANVTPTDEHLAVIEAWINAGAPARYEGGPVTEDQAPALTDNDRSWWAFQRPSRPRPPTLLDADLAPRMRDSWKRVRTPVDAFLLDKLAAKNLTLNDDAPPASLVRRAYLDLIGLPPSPTQIDAYVADESPDRFVRLIDRLLASPHYGERWARHWLDAAGYSEILGREFGGKIAFLAEGIWRYRDYVIEAWNEDIPYDRFLLEQLAGDELVAWRDAESFTPEMKRLLVATGFLRLAADHTVPGNNGDLDAAPLRHQVINDTLEILGSNLLGLTVKCAQCHSHKYEPISQLDYYQLRALLAPAFNTQNWLDYVHRFQWEVSPKEHERITAHNAEVDARVAELKQQISDLRTRFEPRARAAKLDQLPELIRADTEAALAAADNERDAIQKYLAEKLGPLLEVTPEDVTAALDEPAKQTIAELESKVAARSGEKRSPGGKIPALWDVGPPPPEYIFRRGQFADPGAEIQPGVLAVLNDAQQPFELPQPAIGAKTSGYRLALARWLTRPDTAAAGLTARVFVNRIWRHYFERGIVASVGNLGQSGVPPTHPRLLDRLAADFIDGGWQVKPLHRALVLSTAYQQSSRAPAVPSAGLADAERIDPENRLLWRMPLRRMDAEVVRDSTMAISGTLDRARGGPSVPINATSNGLVAVAEAKVFRWSLEKETTFADSLKLVTPTSQFRRSVYLFARRNYHLTELAVFDQPIVNTNCTSRSPSAVVQQTLAMLNGKWVQEQAERFARRVADESGPTDGDRLERAFRLALGRAPVAEEIEPMTTMLRSQAELYCQADPKLTPQQLADAALVDLCHMLLNTNEFLYVQ